MHKEARAESRSSPLNMGGDEFRAIGHRLVDRIAEFLDSLPEKPVTRAESVSVVRAALGAEQPVPAHGTNASVLLDRATDLLFEHSLFNGHPSFWGYITSSAAPIGALGDLLASSMNPNVGAWPLSPVATEIEAQTIRWIAELLHYPVDCSGILVSGGNVANLVCFLAARQAKANWNVRELGNTGARLRTYCSKETHAWIQKAAEISGLGTNAIRWISTDARQQMIVPVLREQIAADIKAGEKPFLVIGTAGSVSTGAIDPLPEIHAVCREFDLWFHVDGAYGAPAAMLPDAPAEFLGLRDADSVAVDPHKWLYAPLEAGCALVRDPDKLRNAFAYHPLYYNFGVEAINYFDLGPQNSRGFRALKVWLAIQQVGREGYIQMIADDIRLSCKLFEELSHHDDLEALTQSLSIATFRYVPHDLKSGGNDVDSYLNQLNREILTRIENSGEAFVSNAVIDGKFALRTCIVNFRTNASHIEALPRLVVRLGKAADAELRSRI